VQIMGILNATPDSFSNDGLLDPIELTQQGLSMIEAGADILDVGGESSRPYAKPVDPDEEIRRTLPVIKNLINQTDCPISIDSRHSKTITHALDAGASIINDITGFKDPQIVKIAEKYNAKLVLMHMQNQPENMQVNPVYDDVIDDILNFFKVRIGLLQNAGIAENRIIIDPGIGFGKTLQHNISIFKNLDRFKLFGYPVLVGSSRKSILGKI